MCSLKPKYIGETSRQLKERFREHCVTNVNSNNASEPAKHAMKVHGENKKESWNLKILGKSNNTERRIIESTLINKYKPGINKKAGIFYVNL